MNFYDFFLIAGNPKKFAVNYRHLTITNRSADNITVYFQNGSVFCKLLALDSFTFLDVTTLNRPLKDRVVPSMILTIETDNLAGSTVHINNYGV
jgi:hypothetical protein